MLILKATFAEVFKVPLYVNKGIGDWKFQTLNSKNFPKEEEKGWKDKNKKVEGGESLNDVKKRSLKFIKSLIKKKYSKVLVVSHGANIELICGHYAN